MRTLDVSWSHHTTICSAAALAREFDGNIDIFAISDDTIEIRIEFTPTYPIKIIKDGIEIPYRLGNSITIPFRIHVNEIKRMKEDEMS